MPTHADVLSIMSIYYFSKNTFAVALLFPILTQDNDCYAPSASKLHTPPDPNALQRHASSLSSLHAVTSCCRRLSMGLFPWLTVNNLRLFPVFPSV